jgi:DNA-binding transcriptional MerR regulator
MAEPVHGLTIDDLAARTGVSVRNVRYYQTIGLIPPPRVVGRTGYYDERHVDRLALIDELQQEGLNLRGIGFLLGGADSVGSDELRSLKRAVLDGWVTERPQSVPTAELLERLDLDEADEATVARAIELGLVEPAAGEADRWRVLMPTVLQAGAALHALGVPSQRSLDALAVMRDHLRTIGLVFVELFDDAVLQRFDARGRPPEEWPHVRHAVDDLRGIAGESILAVFNQVMRELVAGYLAEVGPESG